MKRIWKLLSLILVIFLLFTAYYYFTNNKEEDVFLLEEKLDRSIYKIECELNPEEKTLTAKMELDYYNNDNIDMKEIFFHVYPNAFKNKETATFLCDDFDNAYKRGFEPGYAYVISVSKMDSTGEKLLNHSFSGIGETILKVELDSAIKPKERANLKIYFKLYIPPASERFGYGESL